MGSYPLTRRAIVAGVMLGVVFTFIAIYLYLKVGIVALAGIFIIGYLILSLTGGYDARENAMILTIAGACNLAAMGFIDPIVALLVYKDYISFSIPITFRLIISLLVPGVFLGVFLLYPLHREFVQLRWPLVTPMAYMVKVLEKTGSEELRYALKGMGFSILASSSLMATGLYQIDLSGRGDKENRLSFTGVTISPLYAGLGFFISYLGYLFLMGGVVYSMLVWFFVEGGDPAISVQQHFFNPFIYSVAVPMMITTAILSLISYSKGIKSSISSIDKESRRIKIMSALSLVLLPCVAFVSLWLTGELPFSKLLEVVEIILVALPIVFISAIFAVRAAGETGFSTSITLDATLIIVLFIFAPSFESILLAFAIVGVFESIAISFIRRVKFCSIIGVDARKTLEAVLIGGLTGIITGPSLFLAIHYYQGGVGSSNWPAPMAKLLGGYILLFYIGIKERKLPPMIKPSLLVISVLLTIIIWVFLQKRGLKRLSPILIAIGMIIPPSYLWIASIGAFIDYWISRKYRGDQKAYMRERSKWNAILSGVMSGEGLVLFAITIFSIVPLLIHLIV
ncbi:MAG: OPT/YSL family transporter [Candidatus Njordarchaeales archaeon]